MATTPNPVSSVATSVTSNLKHFYIGVVLVVAAIVGGCVLHAWMTDRKAEELSLRQINAQTAQVMATNAAAIKVNQATVAAAQQAEVQNQQNLSTQLAAIKKQKAAPITPVDYDKIDQMIAQHVGASASDVKTASDPNIPDAPMTTLPTQQLRDTLLTCDETKVTLNSCQNTTKNLNTQLEAANSTITVQDSSIAALQTENKQKDVLLKGGTFWHRFLKGAEHAGCGAGAMGAGILAAHSTGTGTSAVVGAGVFGGCEFLIDRK